MIALFCRGKDFERGWHKVHMKQNNSEIYLPTDQDAQVDLNVVSVCFALKLQRGMRALVLLL